MCWKCGSFSVVLYTSVCIYVRHWALFMHNKHIETKKTIPVTIWRIVRSPFDFNSLSLFSNIDFFFVLHHRHNRNAFYPLLFFWCGVVFVLDVVSKAQTHILSDAWLNVRGKLKYARSIHSIEIGLDWKTQPKSWHFMRSDAL